MATDSDDIVSLSVKGVFRRTELLLFIGKKPQQPGQHSFSRIHEEAIRMLPAARALRAHAAPGELMNV